MRDRPAAELFLISWLVLFLELACIRWFPAHVLFLTFFVNLVLLACFVGMSVGCLVARRPTHFVRHTPYWLLAAVLLGLAADHYSEALLAVFAVDNPAKPEVVYFGAQPVAGRPLPFAVPIELVGALFFALVAAAMVGPGQEMGRAFTRVPDRTAAYSANLLGGLLGIGTFAACAALRLPPLVWFGFAAAGLAYFVLKNLSPPPPPLRREGEPDQGAKPRAASEGAAPAAPPLSPPPFLGEGAGGRGSLLPLAALAAAAALTAATSGYTPVRGRDITWSEYYRIDYEPANRVVVTNLISHQAMEPRDRPLVAAVPYALPYLFRRDLKASDGAPAWPAFRRVLVIGAGNGNDVARALAWVAPDARVDAVEIDPVIQSLGARHHPDRPFQDPRVTVHINDGRNFLRDAPAGTYDLVVFALIDSLVLQSGYSNLRLESYLFTRESFQDVRRVLKPTGVAAVYNFLRQGWVAARIRDQLRAAFDCDPVTIVSLTDVHRPPLTHVKLDDFEPGACTAFFAGGPAVIDPLRRAFAGGTRYWYPWHTGVTTDTAARFGTDPPPELPPRSKHALRKLRFHPDAGGQADATRPVIDPATGEPAWDEVPPMWLGLAPATIEESGDLRPADDDWPFLYTRAARVPGLTWRSVALTLFLSVALWALFGGRKALAGEAGARPDYPAMARAFFLGAGFMLIETKAVVEMALLFGGTWAVNTAVFAAVLAMSLLGNLFAGRANPARLWPYYAGLFAALALGLAVPPGAFLGLGAAARIAGACAVVFAPVAFAGVIFATSFTRTAQPDRVFGANVAGALVGGLAENLSVVLGFRLLLCAAAGFYLLSALFGNRLASQE